MHEDVHAARNLELLQRRGLTEVEFWLLSEIIRGTSEAEVALQLFVYEDTVRQRLRNIFRKIGVRTRAEAAAWLEGTERRST